jgi:hypothetical protein
VVYVERHDFPAMHARHPGALDEYARGDGQLRCKAMNELGIDVVEAAAMF